MDLVCRMASVIRKSMTPRDELVVKTIRTWKRRAYRTLPRVRMRKGNAAIPPNDRLIAFRRELTTIVKLRSAWHYVEE